MSSKTWRRDVEINKYAVSATKDATHIHAIDDDDDKHYDHFDFKTFDEANEKFAVGAIVKRH